MYVGSFGPDVTSNWSSFSILMDGFWNRCFHRTTKISFSCGGSWCGGCSLCRFGLVSCLDIILITLTGGELSHRQESRWIYSQEVLRDFVCFLFDGDPYSFSFHLNDVIAFFSSSFCLLWFTLYTWQMFGFGLIISVMVSQAKPKWVIKMRQTKEWIDKKNP